MRTPAPFITTVVTPKFIRKHNLAVYNPSKRSDRSVEAGDRTLG
jgi:hypothetical protein